MRKGSITAGEQTGGYMTIAEQILARYQNDEQVREALATAGGRWRYRDGIRTNAVRYTLPDGSVITIDGSVWGLGYPGCYCLRSAGHVDNCASGGSEDYRYYLRAR